MKVFGAVSAVGVIGLAAGVSLGPAVPVRLTLGDGEYLVSSPEDPRLREAVRLRARAILDTEVQVRAADHYRAYRVAELGYSVNEAAFFEDGASAVRAAQERVPGSWSGRFVEKLLRRPKVAAAFIPLELDVDVARRALTELSREVDRDPVDAEMRIEEYRIVPSERGRKLSVESSLVRLRRTPIERGVLFEADVSELRPQVTEEQLLPVDITRVLAAYETSYRGKAGSRAVNIRAAAEYLNGAVILPGEQLSFNERVGRRIHGRGFVDAPVIVNDEMEQDVGGGVCQVASTLHAAAVFGNLKVVHRRSHSRPSGYAPPGLDATVIDGEVDLKLQNPYDEPLLVRAWVNKPDTIRVELLGRDPDVKVEHAYSVTHREPFARRVWYRSQVSAKSFEKKQKGSEGMDVVSVLKITEKDGKVSRRQYFSKYYPVPEVFWVGKDVPVQNLPELPSGATGLVVEGQAVPLPGESKTPSNTDVPSLDEADSSRHRG